VAPRTSAGTASITRYEPKRVEVKATATTNSVLLLNDRYHPHWFVWVDGKPQPLLRCNYMMRGVFLTAGEHTVEFRFNPPATLLYVSLAAVMVGLALCGFLGVTKRPASLMAMEKSPSPEVAAPSPSPPTKSGDKKKSK
jgi:uncharacterized membrane protein YfhO